MAYAEGTGVSPEKSQQEIATVVRKYGAKAFATGYDEDRAFVQFIAHNRTVRFVVEIPSDPAQFAYAGSGSSRRARTQDQRVSAMLAEERRRWRTLLIAIKAKFDVVESGISTFETEFMPHTVMPDGRTVAEHVMPSIERVIESGQMPTTLLAIEGAS